MKKILFLLLMVSSLIASPRAIVFDFNGVMTREPNRETIYPFLHETLHLSKAEFEKVYEALLSGKTDREFWRSLAKEKGVLLTNSWGKDFTAIMRDSFANPEMFALVDRLKQKQLPMILFSNMDAIPARHFREMGLFEPFDRHIFAFEIGAAKPDPKAYQILLQELDLPPEDIIFIDDQPDNIRAAQAIGMKVVLFQSASQLQEDLEISLEQLNHF